MKRFRILGLMLLALVVAAGISACQKQADTEVSQNMPPENPATAQEPAPEATTPPAVEPAPPPPPGPPPATKPTTKSATTKKTTAVNAAQTKTVSLPTGTPFEVELVSPVSTATNNVGDKVEAKLTGPLLYNNMVIANQGAVIRGEIAELMRPSKSKAEEDRASLKFAFTSIETVDGEKTLAATVTNAEVLHAGGTTKRDALMIGGSAVAGAVLGKIIGGDTKDAAIGAVAGAAVGTGGALLMKGHNLELPAGSKLSLKVDQPITIVQR
jgi:hypothetical protein